MAIKNMAASVLTRLKKQSKEGLLTRDVAMSIISEGKEKCADGKPSSGKQKGKVGREEYHRQSQYKIRQQNGSCLVL